MAWGTLEPLPCGPYLLGPGAWGVIITTIRFMNCEVGSLKWRGKCNSWSLPELLADNWLGEHAEWKRLIFSSSAPSSSLD